MTIHVCEPNGKYIASYPGPSIPETCPGGSYTVESAPPDAGATWDGEKWLASEPAQNLVPLEQYQFHAMLKLANLEGAVKSAIAAMPDETARAVAEAKLERTREFNREDSLVIDLSTAIGLTSAELDEMWLKAAKF